jgi:uncharacterized protein
MKGQIIGGNFSQIFLRQKSGSILEIGELLVSETDSEKMIFQVTDLKYSSQLSQQNLELISGMQIEEDSELNFFDENTRNYIIAQLKNLITISKNSARMSKSLPTFFSHARSVRPEDFSFLQEQKNPLFLGRLRSGSKTVDFDIFIDGKEALTHHILVCATTGKGKSNLVKSILWNLLGKDYCGILVLDPHDEYFGRNSKGLRDHLMFDNIMYYTPKDALPGTKTLKINLHSIRPQHLSGILNLSDPQAQAMYAYFRQYKDSWIEAVVLEKELSGNFSFHEGTVNVLRRNLIAILNLEAKDFSLSCHGIFDSIAGQNTVKDIVSELEDAKIVIIDTSSFAGNVEILIGSIIASELLKRYKIHKSSGILNEKPVISIILEEAPRVLGKNALESGPNIFSTIAREGRKFKIGLLAITQLPSLIPREILANINTKIILGLEMKPERESIIDSSPQDLSSDDKNIASLDKGEAIVTSTFVKFPTPIKIPLFDDLIKQQQKEKYKKSYAGIDIIE